MSWAEVKKINSDMQEPLNYTHYIADISSAGKDSYVLDENNSAIWDELALNSCYLYGHTKIHDTVLNRLTTANVDALWEQSANLGRQLNNFHSTTAYATGDAAAVLNGMTMDAYNAMITPLRDGYCRYCNAKLTGDGAIAWINEVFGVDLTPCTTIDEVLASEDAFAQCLNHEGLMVALTSSSGLIAKIAAAPNAVDLITKAIQYVGKNGEAIEAIADNDALTKTLAANASVMAAIATEENAFAIVLKHEVFATNCLASTTAMTAFANSAVAVRMICQFYADMSTSKSSITNAGTHSGQLKTDLNGIWQGETALEGLTEFTAEGTRLIDVINGIMGTATMVNDFVTKVMANATYCAQVAGSAEIMGVITKDATLSTAIAGSATMMAAVFANTTATNAVLDSVTALNAVAASDVAMAEVNKSTDLITKVWNKLTWAQVSSISAKAAKAASTYASWCGLTKTITLTGISSVSSVTVKIIGIAQDVDKSNNKLGFTLQLTDGLSYSQPVSMRMNSSNTTTNGWGQSEMRSTNLPKIYDALPSDLKAVIKKANKKYSTTVSGTGTIQTAEDSLWLLSYIEVFGDAQGYASDGSHNWLKYEGEWYKWYKDHNTNADRVIKQAGGSANLWWLRSPYSSSFFCFVVSSGSWYHVDAGSSLLPCAGFCV